MSDSERAIRPPDRINAEPAHDNASRRDPSSQRLTQMTRFDVGEQIIGSRHKFALPAPMNLDGNDGPALGSVAIAGASQFDVSWSALPALLQPLAVAPPIDVIYVPTVKGEQSAELSFVARWTDGHVEQQRVEVVGAARTVEDAPRRTESPTSDSDQSAVAVPLTSNDGLLGSALDAAMQGVLLTQKDAVGVIKAEQEKYQGPTPERSIWWDLAELAIVMGTAGIGSVIGHLVETKLARLGTSLAENETAEHVPIAAKAIAHAVEHGYKHVVDGVAKRQLEPAKDTSDGQTPVGEKPPISEDKEIAFFAGQSAVFNELWATVPMTRATWQAGLAPLVAPIGSSALVAAMIVEAISAAAQGQAMEQQMSATLRQWVAYRARGALGADSVSGRGAARHPTDLARAREFDGFVAPGKFDGLVDIRVELRGDSVRVVGARAQGLSHAIANRLLRENLKLAQIPLRIVIGRDDGFITVDEQGQVRYSGFAPLEADAVPAGPAHEVQQLRGAQRIVDEILGQSLASWGLDYVATDDQRKR